jgi:hypothetical protein
MFQEIDVNDERRRPLAVQHNAEHPFGGSAILGHSWHGGSPN